MMLQGAVNLELLGINSLYLEGFKQSYSTGSPMFQSLFSKHVQSPVSLSYCSSTDQAPQSISISKRSLMDLQLLSLFESKANRSMSPIPYLMHPFHAIIKHCPSKASYFGGPGSSRRKFRSLNINPTSMSFEKSKCTF